MAETGPDVSIDNTLDMYSVEYVPGYDEPDANVVFMCSDKKAFRIHDYFLKAESPFFREMLQSETKGGPIGVLESSADLLFIFDRLTKKAFDGKFPVCGEYSSTSELVRALDLEKIASKYILETVTTCLRRFVKRYANQDPPKALAFAANLQPPDGAIAEAAMHSFKDAMEGSYLEQSINVTSSSTGRITRYVPAPHRLKWSFVEESLGLKAYYAYVLAMEYGRQGQGAWNWDWVASKFIAELKMTDASALI